MLAIPRKVRDNLVLCGKSRDPREGLSYEDVPAGEKQWEKRGESVTMSLELGCENTEEQFCPRQVHTTKRGLTLETSDEFTSFDQNSTSGNIIEGRKEYRHT